jgi:EpsI family protein
VALAFAPLLWSSALASAGSAPVRSDFLLPNVPGWTVSAESASRPWRPHFAGADFIRIGHYRDSSGREVDLTIAFFARQREGAELVGFGQGAVEPNGDWSWTMDSVAPPNGRAEIISSNRIVRHVVSFYRVGEITTGSSAAIKLETIKVRLFGGRQRAVAILVSAQTPGDGADPRPAIDDFLSSLGSVDTLADGIRSQSRP